MHILQAAVRGFVDRIAEIGLEPVIPGGLKVADLQVSAHQRTFKIKAQHDVQVVLHLVGLGADIAVMDAVHVA